MSTENDPVSETLKRHISELWSKKKRLKVLKKDIQDNPDERYIDRKEVGKEVKELEALICEEMDDGDEVMIGKRLFKKQRTEVTRFSEDRVHEFCEHKNINPQTYDEENREEKICLKAVGKQK